VILEHNRKDVWGIPKSIMGKFSSIIDTGLISRCHSLLFFANHEALIVDKVIYAKG